MNKLTKQWFDDVNRDVNDLTMSDLGGSKVFFKKPSPNSSQANGKLMPNKYAGSTTSGSSKILLESTDEEDEDDEDEIVIDKNLLPKK